MPIAAPRGKSRRNGSPAATNRQYPFAAALPALMERVPEDLRTTSSALAGLFIAGHSDRTKEAITRNKDKSIFIFFDSAFADVLRSLKRTTNRDRFEPPGPGLPLLRLLQRHPVRCQDGPVQSRRVPNGVALAVIGPAMPGSHRHHGKNERRGCFSGSIRSWPRRLPHLRARGSPLEPPEEVLPELPRNSR